MPLRITKSPEGVEIVQVSHPSGSRTEINMYGCTVTSFYPASSPDRDVLFVSEKAVVDGTKAIRGGIPLVFPVFGASPDMPNHGFARISNEWKVDSVNQHKQPDEVESDLTEVWFVLESNEETRKYWPHEFTIKYQVQLRAESLQTALHVVNCDDHVIEFQALLHSYFRLPSDISNVRVEGLKGVSYFDKVAGSNATEEGDELAVTGETDRVFANAPDRIHINFQDENKRRIVVEKWAQVEGETQERNSDVVVWNPWIEKAKGMGDFGDDEYHHMICVEPGRVSAKEKLQPGKMYILKQTISIEAAQ